MLIEYAVGIPRIGVVVLAPREYSAYAPVGTVAEEVLMAVVITEAEHSGNLVPRGTVLIVNL